MFQPMAARCLAVSSALLALGASAQAPTTPGAGTAPQARATPGQYRSALEGYQPYSESKMVPWKEANDTVGKVGGWRAYAKEAAEGQAADGKAPGAGNAANPHAGHGKPEEAKK